MIQNDPSRRQPPFRWTPQQLAAVPLVADGQVTDQEIAERLGVKRATVVRWKRRPEFAERVAALVRRATAAVERATILAKAGRLETYQRRHDQIEAVIAARALEYANVPGGATGLLVAVPHLVKVYEGEGEDAAGAIVPLKLSRVVYTMEVDTALLKEHRETLKQAAIELRQWVERSETTNRPGLPGTLDLAKLTDDELEALEILTLKATAGEGPGNA